MGRRLRVLGRRRLRPGQLELPSLPGGQPRVRRQPGRLRDQAGRPRERPAPRARRMVVPGGGRPVRHRAHQLRRAGCPGGHQGR